MATASSRVAAATAGTYYPPSLREQRLALESRKIALTRETERDAALHALCERQRAARAPRPGAPAGGGHIVRGRRLDRRPFTIVASIPFREKNKLILSTV